LFAIALIAIDVTLKLQQPSFIEIYLDAVAWLVAGLTLSIVVARAVFAPGKVTFHRIVGAILLYLSIGWVFVGVFSFVALVMPNAFKGFVPSEESFINIAGNLIHFSFITLTTTGYGDISPVHPYARSLASIEAIIGQLYPAILVARLVTLEVEDRHIP
jgi:hypothetical protein